MTPVIYPITDNPQYYRRFKLEIDPFPDAIDNILYLTPEIRIRLERIKEAIAGSHKVVVITSSPGAGKSTLADYLESQPEEDWRMSLVQAETNMGMDKLAHAIVRQALPDKAEKTSMAIPMLHKYLELASHSNFVPVFIIEDADRLPLETLKFVLELATLRYAESLFHIVLFADESLLDKLEDPALDNIASGMVFGVHLPSLSRAQMIEYIDTRLNAAGEVSENPFDEAAIDYIYKISAGLPGGINMAARQLMQRETGPEAAYVSGKIAAGLAIAITAGLLLYFYLFQDHVQINSDHQTVITQPAPAPVTMPIEAAPESETSDNTIDGIELSTQVLAEAVSEPPESMAAATTGTDDIILSEASSSQSLTTDDAMIATDASSDQDTTLPAQLVNDPPDTAEFEPAEATPIAAIDVVAPVATMSVAAPLTSSTRSVSENIFNLESVPAIVADIRGNSWYRSQPRTAYTLQLISASAIENVVKLLEEVPGIQAELSGYVRYTPSGRPRYLMFYGLYTDKDAAAAAVSSLPAGLQAVNPWPRSIGNITDEIDTVVAPPR